MLEIETPLDYLINRTNQIKAQIASLEQRKQLYLNPDFQKSADVEIAKLKVSLDQYIRTCLVLKMNQDNL